MKDIWVMIITALLTGIISRIYMLRVDTRQYPTQPQGVVSHLTLGLIAAFLGSVALPSLLEKELSAVTFLALAAQQFRDVRNLERKSLDNIEPTELVPRGVAYIEDIAKAFESRNYIVIITSLLTTVIIHILQILEATLFIQILSGIIVGFCVMVVLKKLSKRTLVKEIAQVKAARLHFDGPTLKVDDIIIKNVGLSSAREIYEKNGLAVEIVPNDDNASATLSNKGQRQAVLHNAAIQLGIRMDEDEPDFVPMARRNHVNGNIVIAIIPMKRDLNALLEVVKNTPVLESSKRITITQKREGAEV